MNIFLCIIFAVELTLAAEVKSVKLKHASDGSPIPYVLSISDSGTCTFSPETEDDYVFIIVPEKTLQTVAQLLIYLHNNTVSNLYLSISNPQTGNQPRQIISPDRGCALTVVYSLSGNPQDIYASTFPSPPKNYTVIKTIKAHERVNYNSAGYPSFAYGGVWETWRFVPETSNVALIFLNNGFYLTQYDDKFASLMVSVENESADSVLYYNCTDSDNKTFCPDSYTAPVGKTITVRFETTEAIINKGGSNGNQDVPAGISFTIIGSSQHNSDSIDATTKQSSNVNSTATNPPTTTKGAGSLSPVMAISGVLCISTWFRN